MLLLFFIGIILLVLIDQLTKLLVINTIKGVETLPLIQDVFHLTYWENRGAAFGILQNQRVFFVVLTILIVLAVVVFMIVKKPKSLMLCTSLTLLMGGAIGNFIDRALKGYVVDFLDFRLINFPIFNAADCFVVVGAVLLAVYLIFMEDKIIK